MTSEYRLQIKCTNSFYCKTILILYIMYDNVIGTVIIHNVLSPYLVSSYIVKINKPLQYLMINYDKWWYLNIFIANSNK